jgi:hypothetical protein
MIVDMLIDALASPQAETQHNAQASLVAIGPHAVAGLVLRLGRFGSSSLQVRIAEVLALIGPNLEAQCRAKLFVDVEIVRCQARHPEVVRACEAIFAALRGVDHTCQRDDSCSQVAMRDAVPNEPNLTGEDVRLALDWQEMVRLEPALGDLLAEVKAIKDDGSRPSFCRDALYLPAHPGEVGLKCRITELVGWSSRNRGSLLGTSEAYDIALRVIIGALPPCRNCGCATLEDIFGEDAENVRRQFIF